MPEFQPVLHQFNVLVKVQEPGPATDIPRNGEGPLGALHAQFRPARIIPACTGTNTLILAGDISGWVWGRGGGCEGGCEGGGAASAGGEKYSDTGNHQRGETGRETGRGRETSEAGGIRWETEAAAKRPEDSGEQTGRRERWGGSP